MYGADIKTFGGIDRVFSHNASDPLHADNLPDWCTVTAIDAFDAAAILQYGGDRNRAMREMAERFGLTMTAQKKELAKLLFRMIRHAPNGHDDVANAAAGALLMVSQVKPVMRFTPEFLARI